MMITINIARDFSVTPGPRFVEEGEHSGEEFRQKHLQPKFELARGRGEPLIIELDGVRFGYPTSFLEEAFAGLARLVGIDEVLSTLEFRSAEEPSLPDEIVFYVKNANTTSLQRAKGTSSR